MTGSCYTTIAIAIERFLAVKHPFLINKHNSKFRAIIIPIFLYAFVYNLPRFFHWEIEQRKCKNYDYDYDPRKTNATCTFTDITKFGNNRIYQWVTINTSTMDLYNVKKLFLRGNMVWCHFLHFLSFNLKIQVWRS